MLEITPIAIFNWNDREALLSGAGSYTIGLNMEKQNISQTNLTLNDSR